MEMSKMDVFYLKSRFHFLDSGMSFVLDCVVTIKSFKICSLDCGNVRGEL